MTSADLPEIVTFWRGPLDRLRRLCLASQVAAGHRVTVYSFEPIDGLPAGVAQADAGAVLPKAFAERLRPSGPNGEWIDWTMLQFSDFFRMRLFAQGRGVWLDADVLLLKPVQAAPDKPYFAWEKPAQLGNSALYLPPDDPIVGAFERLIAQDELTPDWLSTRHRLTFQWHRLTGRARGVSDIRVSIFGPAALTALARRHDRLGYALPRGAFYAVHAEPRLFFEPRDTAALIADPQVVGFHISPKGRGNETPRSGSLYAWAAERFAPMVPA